MKPSFDTINTPFGRLRMRYLLLVVVALSVILLVLLASATTNTTLFARHYNTLAIVNGVIIALLMLLVGLQFWRLGKQLKAGAFGAKLTRRLVVLFGMVAVIPGALVYGVSVEFLSRSIESHFDVRIDRALEHGVNLGRNALNYLLSDVVKKTESVATTLSEEARAPSPMQLNRLREQIGVEELALFNSRGQLLVYARGEDTPQRPEPPSPTAIRKIRLQQTYSTLEALTDAELTFRVVAPVNIGSPTEPTWMLQSLQPAPKVLQKDAEAVQEAFSEYQSIAFARVSLKRLYGLMLTLALLLALSAALALAFFLSERISKPLSELAEGTRAVAHGDFSRRHPVRSNDELGILTESFNTMTSQLADARHRAETTQREIQGTNAYLEGILRNLSAGVLALDHRFRLRDANPSAAVILQQSLQVLEGRALRDWAELAPDLDEFSQVIRDGFEASTESQWQKQADLTIHGHARVLLLRGTRLTGDAAGGYVVVFDDLTELIHAQRDAAWAEVARRLAHEIKNPLTPIQLSAERLQVKLGDKLAGTDSDMLRRGTQTIVSQVAAMKAMVDDFSTYARKPRPGSLQPTDLNALLVDVLGLYENQRPFIHLDLGADLDPIMGEQTRLRQVIHNLLQNALDALADVAEPRIAISTMRKSHELLLRITDNGPGFPPELQGRAFEPYVTSKPKGTGLGLAIVKKIVDEHEGRVIIENLKPNGAAINVFLPFAAPSERHHTIAA